MPYLQSTWADLIRGSSTLATKSGIQVSTTASNDGGGGADGGKREDATGSTASVAGGGQSGAKTLRTIPHDSQNKGASQGPDGASKPPKLDSMQMTRLQCMHNIVRSQIDELYRNHPAESTEDESFFRYALQVDTVMFCGKYSNIYLSYHNDHPDFHLIRRVFEPVSKIDPQRSVYLKILKHIGKRHHSLIATWDLFFDANGRVVIFQEYAQYGNLQEYLKQNNIYISEEILLDSCQQIYRGLDFLGDAGICHRAINPKHILITPAQEDPDKFLVKLGSFRDAIIYYDPKTSRIRNQTCRPLDKRAVANYHAPEVFGDSSEEYDPIVADVWSYGATFFFAATRVYPYRYKANVPDIALDIQKTVDQAKTLSSDAKRWFRGVLQGDSTKRTTFDKIETDPWYKSS